MKDSIKVKGFVTYVLKDKDGNVKEVREKHNLITNAGLNVMASLLAASNPDSKTGVGYIAIGSGSGQDATSTALASEITTNGGERAACNAALDTVAVTNDTIKFDVTFSFTGSLAITEAGLFNDSSAGDMIAYQDFSTINVADGDSLQIVWKVTFA